MKIYSHSLQGKRDANEDKHVNISNLNGDNKEYNNVNFFAVFDGHGGKAVSKYLKDNLSAFFVYKFSKDIYLNPKSSSKYFVKVFENMQSKIIADLPRASQYSGSTACVGIHYKDAQSKDKLWILNVGDSRAVKCNKFNIAEQLSQDHKPNAPEEKARIENMKGEIEFDGYDWRIKGLSLSRAFGDLDCSPYVTHLPHIYNYAIRSSDKFIIFACDGLWDVLSNQDVVDFINELLLNTKYKGNYAKDLAEYAYNKGSTDNITTIVYLL
jgi:protein phosphatase 2C family protein 2/3